MSNVENSMIDADFLREIADEQSANPLPILKDKMDTLVAACNEASDLQLEISSLEDRLSQKKEQLRRITSERIPALMEQAGTKQVVITSKNPNVPDKIVYLKSFCYANIAAGWSEDRRAAAFNALRQHDAADLIKYDVNFKFPRNSEQYIRSLMEFARKSKLPATLKESVHAQTLSKWLRERRQAGKPHPPLDVIGASVGREAVIKDISE